MKINKNVSNRSWMFGDYDEDGVKNIDDPKPLNPKISKANEDKKFWMKSNFYGGEVKLSDELLALQKNNNSYTPKLKQILRDNKGSFGRIKTVPSTLKKLRERNILSIGDIAGATILTKNRKQAYKKEKSLSKKYSFDPLARDDFYKDPKGNVYYAIHNKVLLKKNDPRGIELQIKSKKMSNLGKEMHPYYKKGKLPSFFSKKSKKLYKLGY